MERPRRSVTLKDVARASGVSITTVSRILNNRETGVPVREDTRQRILQAAKTLGYRPNLAARGLRGGRSALIGVIARDISDPFHIQILRGINDAASANDYRLFLGHLDHRPEATAAYSSMFEHSHADGIIVIGDVEGSDEALDVLTSHHRFVVGVTDRTSRGQIPGVHADSAAGTRLALEHLWQLGHRAIACVSDNRTSDGRLRIAVYEEFLRARDASGDVRVFITNQEPEPSFELGQRLFAPGSDLHATALFATSDAIAIGLIQAAYRAGIAVPGDLSIVGYDDIDLAEFIVPPLTTVTQHGVDMGRAAAELLMAMIDKDLDRTDLDDVVLTPALVVRGSTAPATP